VDAVWASAAERTEEQVLADIDALVAERPADDAEALFEAASARDYAGLEAEAEPLYRAALRAGLEEPSMGRALVQLASTLRNLGRADEAVTLLRETLGGWPQHPLATAGRAFEALALVELGRADEAAGVALRALAGYLPEYGGAVARYTEDLPRTGR